MTHRPAWAEALKLVCEVTILALALAVLAV